MNPRDEDGPTKNYLHFDSNLCDLIATLLEQHHGWDTDAIYQNGTIKYRRTR
jgi:hypothetical protein